MSKYISSMLCILPKRPFSWCFLCFPFAPSCLFSIHFQLALCALPILWILVRSAPQEEEVCGVIEAMGLVLLSYPCQMAGCQERCSSLEGTPPSGSPPPQLWSSSPLGSENHYSVPPLRLRHGNTSSPLLIPDGFMFHFSFPTASFITFKLFPYLNILN